MDYSRIRSAFYGASFALLPIALYVDEVGGVANVTFLGVITAILSTSGAGVAGYHIPSSLSAKTNPTQSIETHLAPTDAVRKINRSVPNKTFDRGYQE